MPQSTLHVSRTIAAAPLRSAPRGRTGGPIAAAMLTILAVGILILSSGTSHAQEVSAADLFQSARVLVGELSLLRKADFDPSIRWKSNERRTDRQLRHVLAKARTVLEKVRMLQAVNGHEGAALDALAPGAAGSDEVKTVIDEIIASVRSLCPLYGMSDQTVTAEREAGKTLSDVYEELTAAEELVTAMGIPEIGHYDVMRRILGLRDDMKAICDALRSSPCTEPGEPAAAELPKVLQPRDIFDRSYDLLTRLKRVVDARPNMSVVGGVVLPPMPMPDRPPVPNDVMSLISELLAETSAVKAKLGVSTATKFPNREDMTGRTPQWCFFYLGQSLAFLDEIRKTTASD